MTDWFPSGRWSTVRSPARNHRLDCAPCSFERFCPHSQNQVKIGAASSMGVSAFRIKSVIWCCRAGSKRDVPSPPLAVRRDRRRCLWSRLQANSHRSFCSLSDCLSGIEEHMLADLTELRTWGASIGSVGRVCGGSIAGW